MKRRSILTVAALSVATLAGLALAPQAEAQRGGPTFGSATINPTSLKAIGGTVKVKLKITSKVSISTVTVRATVPGTLTSGPSSNLTDNGRGVYSGTVAVPANLNKKAQSSNIFVAVTTANGTTEKKVGSVKLKGNTSDPASPPPPPPI